ncbi:MAG: thiamine diphosphokinase [Lactobacillus sp.]|nr:thiamine diphosphokinase [Lactobacillus sp.]
MKALAVLGGPVNLWPQLTKYDLMMGADRGALFLKEKGIIADLAIGDFDSLSKQEFKDLTNQVPDVRIYNPVKDLTDSEELIKAAFIDYGVDYLTIIGWSGARFDHTQVNFHLPCRFPEYAEKISLLDKNNLIHYYLPGKHQVKLEAGFKYFGISCLTKVKQLELAGSKYELAATDIEKAMTFSSNEFVGDSFSLSFSEGRVAVIYSHD